MFYDCVAFNMMVVLNTLYFFIPAWCLMSSSCLMESQGCHLVPPFCLHSCSSVYLVLWLLLSSHFSATGPCSWLVCCFAENSAMFFVGMVFFPVYLVLWLLLSCHFSATGPCSWLVCCFAENSAMFFVFLLLFTLFVCFVLFLYGACWPAKIGWLVDGVCSLLPFGTVICHYALI